VYDLRERENENIIYTLSLVCKQWHPIAKQLALDCASDNGRYIPMFFYFTYHKRLLDAELLHYNLLSPFACNGILECFEQENMVSGQERLVPPESLPRLFLGSQNLCDVACAKGYSNIFRWAVHKLGGIACSTYPCMYLASKANMMETLKWARDRGCPWNEDTMTQLAMNSNVEGLKWAKNAGCPFGSQAMEGAAKAGRLRNLQWLEEAGCRWNFFNCLVAAASGGNLEVVKWIRTTDKLANAFTFRFENDSLTQHPVQLPPRGEDKREEEIIDLRGECLHIAHNSVACFKAAEHGHLEIIKYLVEEGRLELKEPLCWSAFKNAHFNVICWFLEQGCDLKRAKEVACFYGNPKSIEFVLHGFSENK